MSARVGELRRVRRPKIKPGSLIWVFAQEFRQVHLKLIVLSGGTTGVGLMRDTDNVREINAEKKDNCDNRSGSVLQNEAQMLLSRHIQLNGDQAQLLDSLRSKPDGTLIGPSDPDKVISVTLMVRSRAEDSQFDRTIQAIADGKQKPLSDGEFAEKFGADMQAMDRVLKFAADSGLKAESVDPVSGRVEVNGKIGNFNKAFGTTLNDYRCDSGVVRQRQGTLIVPRAVGTDLDGVFGLDERRQAHTHRQVLEENTDEAAQPHRATGYLPTEVAAAYNFPQESTGAGQSVAILEFGGGLDLKDNAQYYTRHNFKMPEINVVGVDGATNSPGSEADGEVTLDSQIIGAIAPDARQMLIFSKDDEQGWIDAITRATFAKAGDTPNSVISISWGDPEARWTDEQRRAQGLAFKKAALKGISVFAASGDDGANDGSQDRKYTTDYPASDPYVTGSGGTRLTIDAQGKIKSEVTWNDGSSGGAGGGGISESIPLPDFQQDLKMPPDANETGRPGRGVPDLAADASPATGYRVRTNGVEEIAGGTSAVSPLFSALTLRINSALGHPVGYLNPFIYKNGNSGIFNDIVSGNINGYKAGKGWDAATGWGSPDGQKLLDALRQQGH